MRKFFFITLCALFPLSAHGAETVYVHSVTAKLFAAPQFGAETVAQLKKGVELRVLAQKAGWHRVRHNGTTGWIPRLLVAEQPPLSKVTLIKGGKKPVADTARRRASSVTTGGATRGLAADERQRVSDTARHDYSAVSSMESLHIEDDEALQFLDEGLQQ